MSRTVDYTALTEPVTRADISAFKLELRQWGHYRARAGSVAFAVLVVFLGLVTVAVTVLIGLYLGQLPRVIAEGESPWLLVPIILGALAIVGAFSYLSIKAFLLAFGNRKWEDWIRLLRFAETNELDFEYATASPQYAGAIFSIGTSRWSSNHLRSPVSPGFEFGTYEYVMGSGKGAVKYKWGYLKIDLRRALPHMLLDSRANNGLLDSNLPLTFRKDQVLSLEGDFDQYFTLYCPKEYERDALYVFTPDLMSLLIDHAAPFDVEVVDRSLFVYSSQPFRPDAATFQRLFGIIDKVGAKTLSQTDRYSDSRVGNFTANAVANAGKRLTRRASIPTIIAFTVLALGWVHMLYQIGIAVFA